MKTFKITFAIAIVAIGCSTVAQAQDFGRIARDLDRARQSFQQVPAGHSMSNRGPRVGAPQPSYHTSPVNHPHYATIPPQYRQYPVRVTADRFDGYNPYTGGINTKNEQVDNTYYDRNREASKQNGTRRWVRRPIYNAQGRVTGYQEGWVWRNSVTGVEHGELKNVTDNGKGGKHTQIQVRSAL